jgi:hypothetical protein
MMDAFNEDKLFQTFVPMPEELNSTTSPTPEDEQAHAAAMKAKYGYSNWYDWNCANWGVKWDASCGEGGIIEQTENLIKVGFDTAWGPPTEFYAKMEELSWDVKAYYFEPGMMFCGMYEDGDDDSFEIKNPDDVPEEIDEIFDIRSWISPEEEDEDLLDEEEKDEL